MQLNPGDTIGEYRIQDIIGDGGFSIVYKAEDMQLLRTVAIKQLRPQAFSEEGSREWFIREARLTASLNHPNIVQIYTLREEGDSLFLVMEYLPGDLHTYVAEHGPLNRGTLLKVASDICRALETLHCRNVIHRDIKPENILIAQENQFKLADFGLAHASQHYAGCDDDASGPQPGTLLYMSPEQALGLEVTAQSDIYSLAVVLYEAVTGHYYLDFDDVSGDEETLVELISDAPPLPLNQFHPTIPPELQGPLWHALSKKPDDRPTTARGFLSEIKSAVSRNKHATLSQRHRAFDSQPSAVSPELLRELYVVRTLRDAKHNAQAAQQQLRALWETYAGVPEVAAEWGETQIALGQVKQGRQLLEQAVRLKPNLPFAQLALADLYRDIDGNPDDADDAMVQAIHADPDLVYAILYEDIVESLSDRAVYDSFANLFRRAASEQSTPAVLHNLGQILSLDRRYEAESIAAFDAAIEMDPEFGPPYVGLGSLLIESDRLDDAIPLLEQAAYCYFPNLMPGDWHKEHTIYQRSHAFLALAVTYAQVGQFENSAIAARTVLDIDHHELEEDAPDLLTAYVAAARAWIKQGNTLRAYKFLNQVIPLAAAWGHEPIFSLLEMTQKSLSEDNRRKRQWDDALDWLKTGLENLRRSSPPDRDTQELPP